LIVFVLLVGVSLVYALVDRKKVTTSSEKAYQAYLNGEDYLYRLYTKEALQEFEQAVKLDPNFAMAYARIAWLDYGLDKKNEYRQAKEKALSLLGRVRDKEKIIINMGFARAEGKSADVDKYSKRLLDKYPDSFEAHEFLASRCFDQREWDKAIDENLKILKKDPDHAASYNILGYSYFYKGDYDKALEYIDRYSSIAQDQANPHDSHGELLLNLGRYDEALVQFRKADSIKPGLYFVVSHLGDTYRAKGMYRDAIGAYLKAKDLGPNEKFKVSTDDNIAMCYIESGQPQKAVDLLTETLSRAPDDLRSHALLGGIYATQGKMEDALLEKGIIGGLVAKIGNQSKMIDLPPEAAEEYVNAKIALTKGDSQDAMDDLRRIYASSVMGGDKIYFSSMLAQSFVKAGMSDSAVSLLTSSLRMNPNAAPCLQVLAQAYAALGDKDAEKGALLRYLDVMKDADDGLTDVIRAHATLNRMNGKPL
jgi:tetratricopeptide (TPR) repeat protein